jgi:hypothetical protein
MFSCSANPEHVLDQVNRRLESLALKAPLALSGGGAQALEDPLWIWGVLGGKDVGKSTLIDALAGNAVSEPAAPVSEGTYRPTVYHAADDGADVRRRFAALDGLGIEFIGTAPADHGRLVLVDLPDFDSLFSSHIDQVRRVSRVLDGIIWLTTPKKVADSRAIQEIQGVLKSRTNFVYVVNKIDWLLAQSNGNAGAMLERTAETLRAQVHACDDTIDDDRAFLISARYGTPDALLEAIGRSRGSRQHDEFRHLADEIVASFDRLRTRLTAPPSAEATAGNKQANLAYQVRAQAAQVRRHYDPDVALRLLNDVDGEELDTLIARALPPDFVHDIAIRSHDSAELFAQWSSQLFRQRIAHWPLLGLIAWPLTLLGSMFSGLRKALRSAQPLARADRFQTDGIPLCDRFKGLVDAWQARCSGARRLLKLPDPDAGALEAMFRTDATTLMDARRKAALEPYLSPAPGVVGRGMRGVISLSILLWFPLIQPTLAALLGSSEAPPGLNVATLRAVVHATSGSAILSGLVVVGLLFGGLTAAVYSRAVRDTLKAQDDLDGSSDATLLDPLTGSVKHAIAAPVVGIREELRGALDALDALDAPDRASP